MNDFKDYNHKGDNFKSENNKDSIIDEVKCNDFKGENKSDKKTSSTKKYRLYFLNHKFKHPNWFPRYVTDDNINYCSYIYSRDKNPWYHDLLNLKEGSTLSFKFSRINKKVCSVLKKSGFEINNGPKIAAIISRYAID